MGTAANNDSDAAQWVVAQGLSLTVGEVVAMVECAAKRPRIKADYAVYSVSTMAGPLNVAEALTNERVNTPKWYRRIMRKQGRIDRLMREAAVNLADFLDRMPKANGKAAIKDALTELDAVAELMRGERGPSLIRRLRRPQCEINEHLSRAVTILSEWAIAPERGFVPADEDGARLAESIRWHSNEATYLSMRRKTRRAIVRRYMCDQFQINRCAIIALRMIAGLFIKD